ncbi:MAG TPA: APC family permease [Vicinamibacterales bacterium]
MTETAASPRANDRVRVVVATTVFLSFISFWRAAAIVLADLGSSAFYAGGIAEQAVGKAAPWFILGVMLFSFAVRAIYIESSVMFVRGGVYRVVKEALGGTLGKLSVSALLFDYVLTGPISAVSAGQYIAGFLNDISHRMGSHFVLPPDTTAALLAIVVIVYFWWRNTMGLRESSSDALHIMQITSVMAVLLLVWAAVTLLMRGGHVPPPPVLGNFRFSDDALGWLKGTIWPSFTAIAVLVGLGHSFLAMSGWESLAQVYREIEHPKPRNLRRAGMVIFLYSLVFTVSVSFLASALIPDDVRSRFSDNLIAGLAMHMAGPLSLRLVFQGFVVVVGFLILAGAVNTAIVGSNAVVNRVSEDGVLPDWFRHPHSKYGTTHRILNVIVALQLLTVVLSRGNVYLLGEAYAFGVVWSFALKSLAVLVLRFKKPGAREWRVPMNLRVGGIELPVGLALITTALFAIAIINLFTKELATIWGVTFTLVVYSVFVASERHTARLTAAHAGSGLDQFQLLPAADLGLGEVDVRPGSVLVPVRDYHTLAHLTWVLTHVDTEKYDVVAMTVRLLHGPDTGYQDLRQSELFSDYEQLLFTRVVAVAERQGRPVKLLVVPAGNVFDAIAQTAVRLSSSQIILGDSAKFSAADQARLLGQAWERVEGSDQLRTRLLAYKLDGEIQNFQLGPHSPTLTLDDLDLIHKLWLDAVGTVGLSVHHRDVVRAALEEFGRELKSASRSRALARIREQAGRAAGAPAETPSPPPAPVETPSDPGAV